MWEATPTCGCVGGEWLSRDPLKHAEMREGPNLYEYCYNNPLMFIDPDGRNSSAFAFGAYTMGSGGAVRGEGEGVAIAGVNVNNDNQVSGFTADVFAAGLAVGGKSNYGADLNGAEVSSSCPQASPINIKEGAFGIEGLFDLGLGFGTYSTPDGSGSFAFIQGGFMGEDGSLGLG